MRYIDSKCNNAVMRLTHRQLLDIWSRVAKNSVQIRVGKVLLEIGIQEQLPSKFVWSHQNAAVVSRQAGEGEFLQAMAAFSEHKTSAFSFSSVDLSVGMQQRLSLTHIL